MIPRHDDLENPPDYSVLRQDYWTLWDVAFGWNPPTQKPSDAWVLVAWGSAAYGIEGYDVATLAGGQWRDKNNQIINSSGYSVLGWQPIRPFCWTPNQSAHAAPK